MSIYVEELAAEETVSLHGQARVRYIKLRLSQGATYAQTGKELGVSRQRIEQIIKQYIVLDDFPKACEFCGLPILFPENKPYSRKCHEACKPGMQRRWRKISYSRQRSLKFHQRETLTAAEQKALDEYKDRGFSVVFAPAKCPFDFVVNSLRVCVLSSTLNRSGRYQWHIMPGIAPDSAIGRRRNYNNLAKRCDVYHCIVLSEGKHQHLFIPVKDMIGRYVISWKPMHDLCRHSSRWDKYLDNWEVLQ